LTFTSRYRREIFNIRVFMSTLSVFLSVCPALGNFFILARTVITKLTRGGGLEREGLD
jgi:hypothetical protein